MIRIAAIGDVHFAEDARGTMRPLLEKLPEVADIFLIAGDITRHGLADEAQVFADEIEGLGIPMACVLGNHDHHAGQQDAIARIMTSAGVEVLEGSAKTYEIGGGRLGVVGAKGFGGGFAGACGSEFGEVEMKAFVRHTREIAERLSKVLSATEADHKVALLHYSPIEQTLRGERLEIYPFMGSYLLAEAIDSAGADLVIHGHSHGGSERGITARGIQVRNVAQPMLQTPYVTYCLGVDDDLSCAPSL
ncbi:MAG TPA: metallophosphoesterase [Actinomycetota bacterium]|nr:metallophosphoesterase [Actinomycetota bacterium]